MCSTYSGFSSNVKVDWSSPHFSQKIQYSVQTWVFVQMIKTEGERSGGYSGKLDESIVQGWGVEALCPAFPLPEPVQVHAPSLGCKARTHLARISKTSFIITMLCALTGQYPHQTCLQLNMWRNFLKKRVWFIILSLSNLKALNAVLQEESRLIPWYQITRIIQSMKPVQALMRLTGDKIDTEGILIFQTWYLRLSR